MNSSRPAFARSGLLAAVLLLLPVRLSDAHVRLGAWLPLFGGIALLVVGILFLTIYASGH